MTERMTEPVGTAPAAPLLKGPVPELPPGPTSLPVPTPARVGAAILGRLLVLLVLLAVTAPLWPIYLLCRLVLARPAQIPPTSYFARCLGSLLFTPVEAPAGAPQLRPWHRLGLALTLLHRWTVVPIGGLAHALDRLLYGRALDAVRVEAPLFELSAARSGSTQIARYLEDDPSIVAPTVLQMTVPFLWFWRLWPHTVGRFVSMERLSAVVMGTFSDGFRERHELDPLRTDTYEVVFGMGYHMDLLRCLGVRPFVEGFSPAQIHAAGRCMWLEGALPFIDQVGRLALLQATLEGRAGGAPLQLMVKGHFLAIADPLEARYPDARFLTVLRAPAPRLQSLINFHYFNATDSIFPRLPWAWLVGAALETEVDYCDRELAWFSRAGGARRVVVRFEDYVRDLPGTLRRVHQECLDRSGAPTHLAQAHSARHRSGYSVNRSLEELHIDTDALALRLSAYRAWCKDPHPGRGRASAAARVEGGEHALLNGADPRGARQGLRDDHPERTVPADQLG
jgi:hypothetical protein